MTDVGTKGPAAGAAPRGGLARGSAPGEVGRGCGEGAPTRSAGSTPDRAAVPVFFTVDDSYVPWLGAALNSLVLNAGAERSYDVVVLGEGVTDEHLRMLGRIAAKRPNVALEFVDMAALSRQFAPLAHNRLRADYFTPSIFYRLFIPDMFPQYDKGVYLDADVVVECDIAELVDLDLGGNLLGACLDRSIADVPELVAYVDRVVGAPIGEYVNSGVLLMDMAQLRRRGLTERFLDLAGRYRFRTVAPDQDYLNAMCRGRIAHLPEAWDAMPVQGKPELDAPKVVHYNLFAKPWCYDGVPYGERFWRYVRGSGFEEAARAFKRAYSPEQREHDACAMRRLVADSVSIAGDEVTFRSVFSSGKEPRL